VEAISGKFGHYYIGVSLHQQSPEGRPEPWLCKINKNLR
jgi:hypothetical protein